MLFVAVRSGQVLKFNLEDLEDARRWSELVAGVEFHEGVTSVSLARNGTRADLPLPRRFRDVRYEARLIRGGDDEEVTAEQVSAFADAVVVDLTMYRASDRFRVDVDRRGRRRWIPT